MLIRNPTFLESWRTHPEERQDMLFVLLGLTIMFVSMALTAALIGWLIVLTGHPRIGIIVAAAMFGFAVVRVLGR